MTRSPERGKLAELTPQVNAITQSVIGAAIEVHRHLGPGLLERLYVQALSHELGLRNLATAREVPITVAYKGLDLTGQRLDLVIEGTVVVEAKAVERVHDVHLAQLVSYLRSGAYPVGLLINFHVPVLKDGLFRRVNTTSPRLSASSAFNSEEAAP